MESGHQQFGPFQIVRTLGRGGMGEVFVARTPWSKNPIAAVKRLRPDVARVPTFAERFQHESELAVRLEHENVVATIDVGSVEGQLYVASELVQGKDTGIIADRLRERGQGGPAAVAIRLMLDVLSGLAYVHEAVDLDGTPLALVHRDITPGNVLVGYDGVAKLADFGLAKSLLTEESNLTQHGEILGTPHYLAPEIIRGESASRLSDLYGLGAVMYRFLTGVAPHTGTTAEVLLKVLSEEPRSLDELRPDLSPWLVTFVHSLLTKLPAQRPNDARALVAQLHLEAKASGLLVPRSAVGRWLSDLFETEKVEELTERDQLIAMEIDDFQEHAEGTVVLAARATTDAPFTAPDPAENGQMLDPMSGTELSIDPDAQANTDAQPAPGSLPGLGAAVPADLTDAGQVIEVGTLEGMPTRAVTMQAGFLAFEEESGTHEMLAPDVPAPMASVSDAATQFSPLQSEPDSMLPGFIDATQAVSAPGATSPEPMAGSEDRIRHRPSSVVVAPLSTTAHDMGEPPPLMARPAGVNSAMVQPVPDPSLERRGDIRTDVDIGTRGRMSRVGPSVRPPARPPIPGRSLLLLAAMLVVAVLLGVFVGALVVSYRSPGVAVVAPTGPLQEQLFRVQTRLVGRVERGEVVPAEVWSKVTRAHAALEEGDEMSAAALLDELEAQN